MKEIILYWTASLAARRRLLAVGERMKQGAPPSSLRVLGHAGFGNCHSEEPPPLLWTKRRPLAANDWNLLVVCGLGSPCEHRQLFAQQPVHEIGACVPAARQHLGRFEAIVELASGDVSDS